MDTSHHSHQQPLQQQPHQSQPAAISPLAMGGNAHPSANGNGGSPVQSKSGIAQSQGLNEHSGGLAAPFQTKISGTFSHGHHSSLGSSPPVLQPMSPTAVSASAAAPASSVFPFGSLNDGIAALSLQQPTTPSGPLQSASSIPAILSPVSGDQGVSTIHSDLNSVEDFDSQRGHVQEVEKIIEYAGPNNQYAKLNTILGRGAYKTVWKALDREDGIEVAWNILETTKAEYSELIQETEILKKVRHPNVIHFYDSWYSNGEFVFITELMTSGTLREYIKKFKNPSMKIIKRWARQILKGLNYLHSQSPPIIHRDIKCDNIFINGSHGEVKIGDMGTAKMKFGKKYTVIGTPEFMAPEMYEEKGYSEKVDIYALGMCLLEMVTGEYPYNECKNAAQIYKKVSQGIKPECLAKVEDKDVLAIILNCLAPENERWTARKLLEHPFFAEDPDVSLLSVDEAKTKLTFQVVFKGSDKQTVKFDFNTERDTAENVVNEMIEEQILSSKFRQFVTAAIHKILRDLVKNVGAPEESSPSSGNIAIAASAAGRAPPVPPRISTNPIASITASGSSVSLSQPHRVPVSSTLSPPGPVPAPMNDLASIMPQTSSMLPVAPAGMIALAGANPISGSGAAVQNATVGAFKDKVTVQPSGVASTTMTNTKRTFGPEAMTYDFEPMARDYPNDFPIEDFVLDVAGSCNRDAEKAKEWLLKLKSQDIMTVGDLRDLHEDDWAQLNLTVFASRALRNGLLGSTRKMSNPISPRLSVSGNSGSGSNGATGINTAAKAPGSLSSPVGSSNGGSNVLIDMEQPSI